MKKTHLLFALALVASLAAITAIGSASAKQPKDAKPPKQQAQSRESGARGSFQMTVHTHSSQYRGPGGAPLLVEPTNPLPFPITETGFSYSSVACENPAPFNDVALNFNPDYPGIEDPAPVRHVVTGTVTDTRKGGERGTLRGAITTYLCRGDEEADQIRTSFSGRFKQTSDNRVRVRGTFRITGGTGTFEDLTGRGSIHGEFTCLPTILQRTGAASCAELGVFSDAIFRLRGSYADPTV